MTSYFSFRPRDEFNPPDSVCLTAWLGKNCWLQTRHNEVRFEGLLLEINSLGILCQVGACPIFYPWSSLQEIAFDAS